MTNQPYEQDNFIKGDEEVTDVDPILDLKQLAENDVRASILCEAKTSNPNYFSIVFANQKFYDLFQVDQFNLIGKNYDFLFSDLDLDYSSEDQLEYVRLIKAVKDFHPCSLIISISNHNASLDKSKFRVTFDPIVKSDEQNHHAILTFEILENVNDEEKKESKTANHNLLKNLERTLHSERLLRQVGSLIVSDLSIQEISREIAKLLCGHLKADRCILHDYDDAKTNFVAEYSNDYSAKIIKDRKDREGMELMTKYINFQNHFFKKFGESDKKLSLMIIDDVTTDQNFSSSRDLFEKFSIVSQITATTIVNGKVNGGMYIHQSTKRNWLADEIELIEMVADQFAVALDRSKSIERVMVSNHSLIEKTAQLKEALRKEQDMRKMQNEFVALVSHEFKTPLQIIDSTRELMLRKIKNHKIVDEAIDKGFERIKSGIQRMNGLIHSTLNLAKMESGDGAIKLEKQVFDLKAFVLDVIAKNSTLATNKQIEVVVKIDELPTEFNGDSKLLDHSFTNIISNAIKYSRNNTTVKVLARASNNKVALRVIDQGIGIPKDDLANIGQKFFRAKNTLAVAGTGIGIYLTKHFIELHGGELSIDSELDVGTTVTVTLPR